MMKKLYFTEKQTDNGVVIPVGIREKLYVTDNPSDALKRTFGAFLSPQYVLHITPSIEKRKDDFDQPTGTYTCSINSIDVAHELNWMYTMRLIDYLTRTQPFMALFDMPFRKVREYLDDHRRDGIVAIVKAGRKPQYLAIGRAFPSYIDELRLKGFRGEPIQLITSYKTISIDGKQTPVTIHCGAGIGNVFCYVTLPTVNWKPVSFWTLLEYYLKNVPQLWEFSRW